MSTWALAGIVGASMAIGGVLVLAACAFWLIRNNPWR